MIPYLHGLLQRADVLGNTDMIARLCFAILRAVYRRKDERLASQLRDLAEEYQR
jgi:hypothetical protein